MLKIGIPRTLLFYYYYPLWKAFFTFLGIETVITEDTSRKIIDQGVHLSVAEICVPIKVCCGHIAALLERDVDLVFLPRMITVEKRKHFCPKFLGLPDMMRQIIPGLEGRLFAPDVRCKHESITDLEDYDEFAKPLNVSAHEIKKAFKAAQETWQTFRKYQLAGHTIDEALAFMDGNQPDNHDNPKTRPNQLTIGLLGYVYNIYDSFVGMDVIPRLRSMGVNVVTFEMLDDEQIIKKLQPMHKTLPWTFSNKVLGAGYNFFNDPNIDGLMHITAFGCGPDSMMGKLFEIRAAQTGKPFMTVRVDEHSGEAHMTTRLEAFTDMLKRKKFTA